MKIIIFITFLSVTTFAQTTNWVWAKKANGFISYDYVNTIGSKLTNDLSGNIYASGNYYDSTLTFGTYTLTANTNYNNFFLAKYDSSGNVIWAKSPKVKSYATLYGIETDSNGNIYITGAYSDSLFFDNDTLLCNIGPQAFFLYKLDSNGNVLWSKSTHNTQGLVTGKGITIDKNNNVYVIGSFNSITPSFDGITLPLNGYYNLFIVKYNANGTVVWAKTQQSGITEGHDISNDSKGNIYCTGYFGSTPVTFGNTTLVPSKSYEPFIAKVDSLGNFLWAKKGNNIDNDNEGYHIATDSVGNSYIIGQYFNDTISFDNIILTNNGIVNDDFFIVKYDPNGNVIWAKHEGSDNYDFANDIDIDKYGAIYVTGSYWTSNITFGTITLNSYGGKNLFIVKYNPLGQVVWAKRSSGTGGNNNYSNGICIDNNMSVYIQGGFSNSSLYFNSTILNNPANQTEFYISKLSQCIKTSTPIYQTSCHAITLNGETFYNSGQYFQTIKTPTGCDSIICLNLTLNTFDSIVTQFSCDPYTLNSVLYPNSGLYHQVYTSVTGCDSIYTLNLTIDNINTHVNQSTNWLVAQQNSVKYQWVDCTNNYAPMSNDTNQIFYPSINGEYAVIITNPSGCFDTSDCYVFVNLSIANYAFNKSISVFPNPFSSQTSIIFSEEQKNTCIKIKNISGKEIKTINFSGKEFELEKGNISSGIYFIEITNAKKQVALKKIIILNQ